MCVYAWVCVGVPKRMGVRMRMCGACVRACVGVCVSRDLTVNQPLTTKPKYFSAFVILLTSFQHVTAVMGTMNSDHVKIQNFACPPSC